MYKTLIEVARKIVLVANKREENQKETMVSLSNLDVSGFDDTYDKQLEDILVKLDLEQVMALQTIMYLGRDKDYRGNTADEIFDDYKKYIESLGVKTKELEIRQMVEKMPLGEYLTEGYRILGIAL